MFSTSELVRGWDMTTSTILPGLATGTWILDPNHSELGFTVRHMMVSKIRGRFRTYSGVAEVADDPLQSTVSVTIDAASFESGNEARDNAVKSAEYLDVAAHPQYTFRSTKIQAGHDGHVLAGDLTIRGITRHIELPFEYNGHTKDPFGNDRIGFSARGEINRKDFGVVTELPMDGGGVVVGEKVSIELDVEFIRTGD
jgi:polyisoprenoid-binding protein YceI